MRTTRPVITLLIALVAVESILLMVGSTSPSSTIQHGLLLGFLFGIPALLIGGLVMIRRPWVMMTAVMYGTIALALDLATIVQEAGQSSPRPVILALTLASSLLNFLMMIFGGRGLLSVQPNERPPKGPRPNLQSPFSS